MNHRMNHPAMKQRPSLNTVAVIAALIAAFIAAVLAATTAWAQPASAPGTGQPPGPPPEAVAACKGKTEGTSVSFALRDGKSLTGTCQLHNGVLAARPAGGPGGQRPPGQK